jgi:hypothetical protein
LVLGLAPRSEKQIRFLQKEFDMADYSFVKDPNGQVVGMWLRDKELPQDTMHLMIITLLKKHQGRLAEVRMPISDDLLKMVTSQNYRVVPNDFDQKGGCFVMFGQTLAPGEEGKTVYKIEIIFVFVLFPKSFSQTAKASFEKEHKGRLTTTLKSRYTANNADVVFVKDWKCKDLTWVDTNDIQNKTPEIIAGINQVVSPRGIPAKDPEVLLKSCYFAIDPETGALIIALPIARS